jgi:hypothetical protein
LRASPCVDVDRALFVVRALASQLLRRTSSRKAGGTTKLTCGDVETLLAEAETLLLAAPEIAQARERLADARQWAIEATSVLVPPVPVTPDVHVALQDLAARAENLNMALDEQDALDTRLSVVREWLARAKAAMADTTSEWQRLTGLVRRAARHPHHLPPHVPRLATPVMPHRRMHHC